MQLTKLLQSAGILISGYCHVLHAQHQAETSSCPMTAPHSTTRKHIDYRWHLMKINEFTSLIFSSYSHGHNVRGPRTETGKFKTSSTISHPLVNQGCSGEQTFVLRTVKCTFWLGGRLGSSLRVDAFCCGISWMATMFVITFGESARRASQMHQERHLNRGGLN
jgi:hypothetical protein